MGIEAGPYDEGVELKLICEVASGNRLNTVILSINSLVKLGGD